MRQLLKQAQQMQTQMEQAQAALAQQTFEATAGGGVVTATVTGSMELVSVVFDPSVLDLDDPELIGDLVVAAVNQALGQAREATDAAMGGGVGGVDLGGLDLGGLLGG